MTAQPAVRFYAESFAPFCERARWALDHHRVVYREIEQVPLVTELTLRIAARRLRGRVTIPLLVADGRAIMSSHGIARWAQARGDSPSLFPEGRETALAESMELSDTLMGAGRALLLPRLLADADALSEQVPPLVPASLRPALRWLVRSTIGHLMRKYGVDRRGTEQYEESSRRALDRVRELTASGYAVDARFSYADIALASALQFVEPVGDAYIRLGPASRQAWTHTGLASEYADLLAWRDDLYRKHRRTG